MSNLNQVILQGNLVEDPKLFGDENKVARFTIAVNTGFGDYKETTFVDCVAFKAQAVVIAEHLTKGKQIIVRGTLIQNRWEQEVDGETVKRSRLEVRLENFSGFFFTGNAAGSAAPATAGEPEAVEVTIDGENVAAEVVAGVEGEGGKLF